MHATRNTNHLGIRGEYTGERLWVADAPAIIIGPLFAESLIRQFEAGGYFYHVETLEEP